LVVQEESQNVVFSTPPVNDESSISVNASDARKFNPRGKGASNSSAGKGTDRFFTFCNRYNHTIEFCYQKHGHPNFNKGNSSANNASAEVSDTKNSIGSNDVVAPDSKFSLTQEKYDHLVALLQQANLLSSAPSPLVLFPIMFILQILLLLIHINQVYSVLSLVLLILLLIIGF
jgi:hypothetical protein